jgi:hypothetical protein
LISEPFIIAWTQDSGKNRRVQSPSAVSKSVGDSPGPSPWHFRGTAGAFCGTLLHSVAGLGLHNLLNLLDFRENTQSAKPLVRDS